MLTIGVPSFATPTALADEGRHPQIIQTLLSHPLSNDIHLSEKSVIKYLIYTKALAQGLAYSDFKKLTKVAFCESGVRHTGVDGQIILGPDKKDAGVFQIRLPVHEARAEELGLELTRLEDNVSYAVLLYKEKKLQPWYSSKKCLSR